MKTYVIIGAGPAGLSAATAISSDKNARIVVIDAGGSISARNHESPNDLGCGVGGAGLFSDGKFSYYPSGTKLYRLPNNDILYKSYERVADVLRGVGIETFPFPKEIQEGESKQFSVKKYPSSYGSLDQRYELIYRLSTIRNCEYMLHSRVTRVTKQAKGKYMVEINGLAGKKNYRIPANHIILATGRLGTLESQQMLGGIGELSNRLRYEFGLRIETNSNLGFLSRLKNPDVKAIWKVPFGEIRTFCTCRNGEIWNIPYAQLSAISGRSDGPKTTYSNFGLLARFQDKQFETGQRILNSIMNSKIITTRKVAWQSLPSFMDNKEPISGNITSLDRPWYPKDDFVNQSIATFLGVEFESIFRSVLKKLIAWSPDLIDPSTSVMFPVIEGVGKYLHLTDELQIPGESIWCCGDVTGSFRGIIPAFVSGHYTGVMAMLSNQKTTDTEGLSGNIKRAMPSIEHCNNMGVTAIHKKNGKALVDNETGM